MKQALENMKLHSTFVYGGKKYVILQKDGNMVEVKDDRGKHWAWPKQAEV